jgi:hypothetical protein
MCDQLSRVASRCSVTSARMIIARFMPHAATRRSLR